MRLLNSFHGPPDHKAHAQTIQALKKRGPGLKSLAQRYNCLVLKMEELKDAQPQFRREVLPCQIDLGALFSLEVDDDLMQDVGLDFGESQEPPGWLADDSVRSGIKAMQLHDRALEEKARLAEEVSYMVSWLEEELATVSNCIEKCKGGPGFTAFGCFRGLTFLIIHWLPCRSCFIIPTPSAAAVCATAKSEVAS